MSWQKLLTRGVVTQLPPTKAELDNLRRIVARCLNDVNAQGLSADSRFIMAYDAARTHSVGDDCPFCRVSSTDGRRPLQHLRGAGNRRSCLRRNFRLIRQLPGKTQYFGIYRLRYCHGYGGGATPEDGAAVRYGRGAMDQGTSCIACLTPIARAAIARGRRSYAKARCEVRV